MNHVFFIRSKRRFKGFNEIGTTSQFFSEDQKLDSKSFQEIGTMNQIFFGRSKRRIKPFNET